MMNEEIVRKENVLNAMANIEYYPVIRNESLLEESTTIPISDVATLGMATFAPVIDAVNKITNSVPITETGLPQLFALDMRGYTGELAALHDGSGYLSTILGSSGEGIIGQAAFVPVNSQTMMASVSSAAVLNPALILGAAIILSVNHKMNMIQRNSEELLSFLKNKDKSKLQANLNMLTDIMNNYKYNIDNEKEKAANANLVKIIKRDSEVFIDFYADELRRKLAAKKIMSGNKENNKLINDLERYQTAVYSYSFAAFLDVLLVENFKKEYLQSVIEKIEEYSLSYRDVYIQCYDYMERYMNTSVQVQAVKGVATASKLAGETLAKVPILSKGPVDELLIETGGKLKNADKQKKQDILKELSNKQSSYIRPFVDNIKKMDEIYNEPKVIMLDEDNIYLVRQECLV